MSARPSGVLETFREELEGPYLEVSVGDMNWDDGIPLPPGVVGV